MPADSCILICSESGELSDSGHCIVSLCCGVLIHPSEGDNKDNEKDKNKDGENGNQYSSNSYGAWAYYNDYGEYVTNVKTIFQIQYYNVVLWTAIGLVVCLMVATFTIMNMPLMPDTLLFGESAKVVTE